ncbi:MAG TPA: indole-3-glycerol phosphate synthase TrpC, partial [Longimicrobiales bacterium]|nr:indole-3-glycerol phosphate synthase TrpC [Longimicrobiales bacterium]
LPEPQGSRRADILSRIVATKEVEVREVRRRVEELRARALDRAEPRGFARALDGSVVGVISEVKRRSPGAGEIRPGLDPAELAAAYEGAGAAALSVLTDAQYFGGSLDDLEAARAAVALPALRKDFTIDEVQVVEARASGADAILLIVRILDDARLRELREAAEALGMDVLVEVHDADELRRARQSGARIIGINNRDLSSFTTDLAVSERLVAELPSDVVTVSESGIRSGDEVARLGQAGIHAVLVGETLLRADDPAAAVRSLAGHPRVGR